MSVLCVIDQKMTLEDVTRKVHLAAPLAYDNSNAHSMRVTVFNQDGTEADLTGISAVGSFMRLTDTGGTVTPINGTVTGNVAEVILPGSCYVVPGRFRFTLNLSELTPTTGIDDFSTSESYSKGDLVVYSGAVWRFTSAHSAGAWTGTDAVLDGNMRTALWVEGVVERNISGTIIDPGTPVGNIEQAIGAATAAATTATAAAGTANTAAQAANDAAAAAATAMAGAVRFDQSQTIPDGGTVARSNIGAADASVYVSTAAQVFTETAQGVARKNVGATAETVFEVITGNVPFDGTDGSGTNRNCTLTRVGQRYSFSRASAHSYNSDFSLLPAVHAANYQSSGSNYDTWSAEATLKLTPGKRYRLTARIVSGTFPQDTGTVAIMPRNESGTSLAAQPIRLHNGQYTTDFLFAGTYLAITAFVSAAFYTGETPIVFDLALTEITEDGRVSGTDPVIVAGSDCAYVCTGGTGGTVDTLSFTPCAVGVCSVRFVSGTTATVLTQPNTVKMPAWWTGVAASRTYEISIADGVYGVVTSWA